LPLLYRRGNFIAAKGNLRPAKTAPGHNSRN